MVMKREYHMTGYEILLRILATASSDSGRAENKPTVDSRPPGLCVLGLGLRICVGCWSLLSGGFFFKTGVGGLAAGWLSAGSVCCSAWVGWLHCWRSGTVCCFCASRVSFIVCIKFVSCTVGIVVSTGTDASHTSSVICSSAGIGTAGVCSGNAAANGGAALRHGIAAVIGSAAVRRR